MVLGYYQFIFNTGDRGVEGINNRMIGTLGFANDYGIFMSFTLVACFMILLNKKWNFNKLIIVPIFSLIVVSIVLSLNRGTWIALTFAIVTSSILYIKKINIKIFTISTVIILIFFSGIIAKRFIQLKDKKDPYRIENTFKTRINYWVHIYPLVVEKPIFGWGIGTSTDVTKINLNIDAYAHNDFLRLGIETGLIGLLLYIVFFVKELIRYLRYSIDKTNWYINYPMLIGIIYFFIISIVQNIFDQIINMSLLFSLIALAHRWNDLSIKDEKNAQN